MCHFGHSFKFNEILHRERDLYSILEIICDININNLSFQKMFFHLLNVSGDIMIFMYLKYGKDVHIPQAL